MPFERNCKWESLKRDKMTTSLSGKGWSFSFEIHKNVKMLTPCTHTRFWSTRSTDCGLLGRLVVHHFHIDHNAPGLPPKVFSWDACNTQQKLGKIWCGAGGEGRGVNKLYYGLYEIGEDALKTSKFIKYIWFFRKFTLVTIQLFRGWRIISTQDFGYNERDFASWQLNLTSNETIWDLHRFWSLSLHGSLILGRRAVFIPRLPYYKVYKTVKRLILF